MSLRHPYNSQCSIYCQSDGANFNSRLKPAKNLQNGFLLYDEESKKRIKNMFSKADISISLSSYDTAWMAMTPSMTSPKTTQFPSCLNWVLTNQLSDGSWGLHHQNTSLIKDALSSTLACVLALKQWGVGELQIARGMEFIASNSAFVSDDNLLKPIGYDIIFPAMIEKARSLNLNIPLRKEDLDALLHRRNLELATFSMDFSEGRKAYLSYISEGMGKYQDWEMVMKYQRKNGSIFNSPSATAAAFSHLQNTVCLQYLNLLLDKFSNAVPSVYPLAIYNRLSMVENLERLGIHHHFKEEIRNVLHETYRYWLQGNEEIFEDTTTLAMAFRLLRSHGYGVSSDALSQFAEEDHFLNTLEGYLSETGPVLELYKASQMMINQEEIILEELNSWTGRLLRQRQLVHLENANKEVDHALRFSHRANLERVMNRRNIEHYDEVSIRMFKSATRSYAIGNKDFCNLAVEEFNKCQLINQEELKYLERWVVENRLDKLEFARQKLGYCYFSAAATLTDPTLSDARISWAKNGVLTTVVDDFFDLGGSEEELENLIQLIDKWNVDLATDCCSKNVEIIYSALRSTICEIGEKAFTFQERDVTHHVTEIWLDLLKSMLRESEWTRTKSVPTMDEYMANGFVSFALGPIVLPTLYLMGHQLPEDAAKSPQIKNLYELMSTCGRLLNDVQGFKRESEEGKLNAVSLKVIHSDSAVDAEEVIKMIKGMISSKRRELLKCVLEEDKSSAVLPRACRDLFWKMSTVLNFFYLEEDGFTSHKLTDVVKKLLEKPIGANELHLSGKT